MGCGTVEPPSLSPDRNAVCAQLFDELDGYDWLPTPVVGFNFRQMQLARIRQANCTTFTRDLAGMEAVAVTPPEGTAPGNADFRRGRAVQAGIVTNAEDSSRAIAFFAREGFRARSVGYPGLGTRIYVEVRSMSDIERSVSLARSAGFVGPYPSRFVFY
jgi:hypothetical protein